MTPHEATNRNDLDWLAFCYVTGELSADDTTAFEERLATDEAACESVARAMELNLAVAAAFADETHAESATGSHAVEVTLIPRRDERAMPSRWTGTALTLIAAAAIAAMMLVAIGSSLTSHKVAKRDGTDRLVAVWAQGEANRNQIDDDNDSLDADDDDLDPPDWMLAAVTAEEQAKHLPGDDVPEVREN